MRGLCLGEVCGVHHHTGQWCTPQREGEGMGGALWRTDVCSVPLGSLCTATHERVDVCLLQVRGWWGGIFSRGGVGCGGQRQEDGMWSSRNTLHDSEWVGWEGYTPVGGGGFVCVCCGHVTGACEMCSWGVPVAQCCLGGLVWVVGGKGRLWCYARDCCG